MSYRSRDPATGSYSSRDSDTDLAPNGYSGRTHKKANSRFSIVLEGLGEGLPPINTTVQPTTLIGTVERCIRESPSMHIQSSDSVYLYRGQEIFLPSDRVGENPRNLQYRVFRAPSNNYTRPRAVHTASSTPSSVGEEHVGIHPLPRRDSDEPTTLAEMRLEHARRKGIKNPNTLIVRLVGGMRTGPVEGDEWRLGRITEWNPNEIVITKLLRPYYLVLRGCGNEYLYQSPCGDEDGFSVGGVKKWLANKLIPSVHHSLRSRISVDPRDISLYLNDELLCRDTTLVEWTAEIEFRLPDDVKNAFLEEEAWLCPTSVCSVCSETTPDKPLQVSANCTHEPSVCMSCVSQWVSVRLAEDGWNTARCPECPEPLNYHEIKAYASKEEFERYETLSTKAALTNMRDFYWCLREGCGSGQIHRPPRSRLCPDTLFVCHACNGKQCTQHAVKWHDGLSCKEYEKSNPRKLRQDKASKRAVEKESIYCPGCNSPVSKISGCSHMECICGHNWCYLCSGAWTEDENNIPYCNHRPDCPELDPKRIANPFLSQPDPLPPPPPQSESQSSVIDLPSDDEDEEAVSDEDEEYGEYPASMDRAEPVRPPGGSHHHRGHGLPSPDMHYSRRQKHPPPSGRQHSLRQEYTRALVPYMGPQGHPPPHETHYSPRNEHYSPFPRIPYYSRQGYQTPSPEPHYSPRQDHHPPSPKTYHPTHRGSRRRSGDFPSTPAEDFTHFLHRPQAPYPSRAATFSGSVGPRFNMPSRKPYWDMPARGGYGPPPAASLPNITVPSRRRRPSVSRRPAEHIEEREPVRRGTRYVMVEVDRREAPVEYRRPGSRMTHPRSPPASPKRLRSAY